MGGLPDAEGWWLATRHCQLHDMLQVNPCGCAFKLPWIRKQGCKATASTCTMICCRLKLPKDRQEEDLHELVKQLPPGLSTSFNLGYLDIYPFTSGKSKAGIYLLTHFHNQPENSVLLCDDDNDLPLAAVVGRVFLPSITSNSVRLAMQADSERFLASKKGGILATEDMLQEIMHLVDTRLQPSGRHGTSS